MFDWDFFESLARICWDIAPTLREGRGDLRRNTKIGMEFIDWTGFGGGELAGVADSHHMGRVEDVHTVLMHLVCYYFMEEEAQA